MDSPSSNSDDEGLWGLYEGPLIFLIFHYYRAKVPQALVKREVAQFRVQVLLGLKVMACRHQTLKS